MTIINNKTQKSWKSIKEISTLEGSPCLECLVAVTCIRSFITDDACEKLAYFVKSFLEKDNIIFKN